MVAEIEAAYRPRLQRHPAPRRTRRPIRWRRAFAGGLAALGGRMVGLAIPVLLPVLLVVLWYVAAAQGWLPAQILPHPLHVAEAARDFIADGKLLNHTQISLGRVLQGFALGTAAGLCAGIAMGLSRPVEDYVAPLFLAVAQVPTLGWVPLLMLFLGIDEALKVVVIAKAAFIPVALNTYKGIRTVPAALLEVGDVLTFGRWERLTRIVLPATVPQIVTGIRYGLTHAWLALVAVELIASSEGLGFLMVWGRQLFQMDLVIVAMVTVGLVGLAFDRILATIERRLQRWKGVAP